LWLPKTSYVLIPLTFLQKLSYRRGMRTITLPLLSTLLGLFQSRALLHLEILALRQQLAMVNQTPRKRLHFNWTQRLFWVWLYRLWPGCLQTLRVFKPDTLVRWQRKGFRLYWTWKSRCRKGGRQPIPPEVRELIRTMSRDNVGWGAPRIHGELQMLGIEVCQATVAKYMVHHPKAAIADVAELSEQSCQRPGISRLLHCAYGDIPNLVRLSRAPT
jgi:hypothetical protein